MTIKYKFTKNDRFAYALIKTKFRLSRLNSIEHIHPQSKKEDWKDYSVDNFGNLLTHSFSSSNYKNHDFFLLNKDEFFVDLDIESSQFRLEIFPNVILKYLKSRE